MIRITHMNIQQSVFPYLTLKVALDALEVVMGVDVSVEVDPGGCGVGAEVALVHDALLIWRQSELPLAWAGLSLLGLEAVPVDGVPIGHDACGLGLGLRVVKNSIIQSLKNKITFYFLRILSCGEFMGLNLQVNLNYHYCEQIVWKYKSTWISLLDVRYLNILDNDIVFTCMNVVCFFMGYRIRAHYHFDNKSVHCLFNDKKRLKIVLHFLIKYIIDFLSVACIKSHM